MTLRHVLIPLMFMALAGCGSYRIRGVVMQGEYGLVQFVEPDNPVFSWGQRVSGASVEIFRDHDHLNRSLAARARSLPDGSFELPLGSFGAGWMEETWEIRGSAPGYHRTAEIMSLPGNPKGRLLLIVLQPGVDTPDPRDESPMRDFERFR